MENTTRVSEPEVFIYCKNCGGVKNPPDIMSLTLWCSCPLFTPDRPSIEDLDPSEIEDYYDYDGDWEE